MFMCIFGLPVLIPIKVQAETELNMYIVEYLMRETKKNRKQLPKPVKVAF